MKIKNKGKVHPSPSSSYSSSSSNGDSLSVLKLLPAAILTLASVLSPEDREVLAYLITHSIKTTTTRTAANPSSASIIQKKSSKKAADGGGNGNSNNHKPPVFDCDCFDCYTNYWFRWDSSPNREFIHQAIEAFEDHLACGESEKSKKNGKGKRRDKTTRRFSENNNLVDVPSLLREKEVEVTEEECSSAVNVSAAETLLENDAVLEQPVSSPEKHAAAEDYELAEVSGDSSTAAMEEESAVARTSTGGSGCSTHKGLARKVLPDVLGLFNSRLWSLWSPNV